MLFNILLLASTASAMCLHGLPMAKRQETADVATFGYGPLNGPFNWASLAVENEACKTGVNQSPINLDSTISKSTEKPVLDIPAVEGVVFENLGTTIEVHAEGTTSFAGSNYSLAQFHIHTPSEHHLNSEYYPLEIHMVHQGIDDSSQLLVIGLMFQVADGESSTIIRSLSASVPAITTPGSNTTIEGGIDFSDVLSKIESSSLFQYSGSLTTPPCSEGVSFLIVEEPLDISVADFNSIKSVVKFNARFIQNVLGQANMLDVAAKSGTSEAYLPAA
ncbi:hypothetical protein ACN47E_001228 [Coniothyrium glycines]